MTSKRSSSKIVLTQGSPRTSSDSLSSRSSSSRSSTSSNYNSSNYAYGTYETSATSNYAYGAYETSATSNMGGPGYSEKASSRLRESYLRVPDAYRTAHIPDTFSPHANSMPATASKDGISKISRGSVDVINHEKRHEDRREPRSSDAKSSEYHKSSSSRKHKQ
jgi:hypothetical protein